MKAYWDIPLSDKPFITNTYYGIDKKSPVGGKYSYEILLIISSNFLSVSC